MTTKARLNHRRETISLELDPMDFEELLEFARMGANHFYECVSVYCKTEQDREEISELRRQALDKIKATRRIAAEAD